MFKVVFFISLKLDQILKVNLDYLNFCSNIIFVSTTYRAAFIQMQVGKVRSMVLKGY